MNHPGCGARKHRGSRSSRALGLGLLAASLVACGGEEQGDVRFEVWGEEYIEEGIPSEEFEDGWSATYDKFLIVLGRVRVAKDGEVGGELEEARLYDLVTPGPHLVGELTGLAAGGWSNVGYDNLVADATTVVDGSATDDDLEWMREGGYAVYVEGRIEKDEGAALVTKTFRWGVETGTRYDRCVDVRGGQETEGIVITDGASVTHELTIHGDHLFYDDLAGDAVLRATAIAAADADEDGEVTLTELEQVPLSSLSADVGSYGVGGFDIDTLGQFVRASTTSLGHFDGEGHCRSRPR